MFTHTVPPISLHSMATRLSQIRLFPDPSRSPKKKSSNRPSSPSKQAKATMHTAHQTRRSSMAHPSTQSQQAGPRRPHHRSYQEQNVLRPRPGGACPVPTSSRADYYQDWHRRDEANVMKALPHRAPLQEVDANAWRTTRAALDKQMLTPPAHSRMSEMHSLIDDYLAWNKSATGLDDVRPDSSGTMFVDFASNGEMEVSYRNGVNKKLPVPPLPSKTLMPSNPHPSLSRCHEVVGKEKVCPGVQHKPLPPHPSISLRHDSAIACDPRYTEQAKAYANRPLPRLPSHTPYHNIPQGRKTYPPQVHRTQHISSQAAVPAPHPPPAPSHSSLSTYHTAPSSRNGDGKPFAEREWEAYSVIEPGGLNVHFQPSFRGNSASASTTRGIRGGERGFASGHDVATAYAFDYDGRTVHVHRDPSSSRPGSWTSEYFDVAASTYSASPVPSYVPSSYAYAADGHVRVVLPRTSADAQHANTSHKALPPLPPLPRSSRPAQDGYERLPEPPRADAKKRHKAFRFVRTLLRKLDDLGVMKELARRR